MIKPIKFLTLFMILPILLFSCKKDCTQKVYELNLWRYSTLESIRNGTMLSYNGITDPDKMEIMLESEYYVKLNKLKCD